VAPEVAKNTENNIRILYSFREKAETYYEKEHTQKIIELLTTPFREKRSERWAGSLKSTGMTPSLSSTR
jgi:hypothetical protein